MMMKKYDDDDADDDDGDDDGGDDVCDGGVDDGDDDVDDGDGDDDGDDDVGDGDGEDDEGMSALAGCVVSVFLASRPSLRTHLLKSTAQALRLRNTGAAQSHYS